MLREESGVGVGVAADLLDCVKSRIYHFESGRTVPHKQDLRALLELYGAPERLEVLEDIRHHANERGWWSTHGLPSWLGTYIGLEDAATRMRRFTQGVVPGMLQTEEYARALNELPGISLPESESKRHVVARMERGSRLLDEGFELSVVLDEALLSRTSYIPDVGVKQLQKILRAMEMPNVTVQVLPSSTGTHQSMAGSFTLLDFPENTLDTVAYQYQGIIENTVDNDTVRHFEVCYTELAKRALDPVATAVEIEEFIKGAEEISLRWSTV